MMVLSKNEIIKIIKSDISLCEKKGDLKNLIQCKKLLLIVSNDLFENDEEKQNFYNWF